MEQTAEPPTEYDQTHQSEHDLTHQSEYDQTHQSFLQAYRCFPLSHINKSHLEAGNRIIMPPSALACLVAFVEIEYPWLFEIENPASGQVSHCGVLEFSAEEGLVFLPNWMMKNMKLVEGELVNVKNTSLPKGTYMKIQPHSMKFTSLANPKAVLERTFRNFSCMTTGDTIMIAHNYEEYYLDIVETKPSNAISVVDTDCEVEFAPPLDYKEPEKKPKKVIAWKNDPDCKAQEGPAKFKPFTGAVRRLDGQTSKTVTTPVEPISTSTAEENGSAAAERMNMATDLTLKSHRRQGKLVFSSDDTIPPAKISRNVSTEDVNGRSLMIEEQKFQPFTGKKYTLAG